MTTVGTRARRGRCLRVEEHDEQLLPGIPNEVTLNKIAPKLSWRDFHVLSSVNHCWLHAIRSRQVYDARVCNRSTETLVLLFNYIQFENIHSYPLYSMQDNKFGFELPPNPSFPEGSITPGSSQCVSLDGNIYVLGGSVQVCPHLGTDKVYVLDVAGQGQWKQCASMKKPRIKFGCAVIDGKIYVFGGIYSEADFEPVCESEVYDPKEDVWSLIKPMVSLRFNHSVETVGGEIFVHGGWFFDRYYFDSAESRVVDPNDGSEDDNISHMRDDNIAHMEVANFLEVYNPVRDEWRVLEPPFKGHSDEKFFAAKGKFYRIIKANHRDVHDIHVLDAVENSWTHLHSFSLAGAGPVDYSGVYYFTVRPVDDELLAIAQWKKIFGYSLVRSIGFGGGKKEIAWQELHSSLSAGDPMRGCHFKCPIQL